MLIKYHSVERNNLVVDEFDDKLFHALIVPFEEIVDKFKLVDAKNEFTPKMFTIMLNKISFDNKHIEVIRIKSKGAKLTDKMQIVKSILNKFGYVYKRVEQKKKIDKKVKKVITGHVISANSDVFRIAALTAHAIGCDQFRVTFIESLKQNQWNEVRLANACNAIFKLKKKATISKEQYDQYLKYWNKEESVPNFLDIKQLMKSRGFVIKEPVKLTTKRLV